MIPPAGQNQLKQAYFQTLSRSMLMYQTFAEAGQALHQAGIKYVVLKGAWLSEFLYQDTGLRQFSDIDMLIAPEDATMAIETLESIGFQPMAIKCKPPINYTF